MGIELFTLWLDGTCLAQHMSIDVATTLVEALFNKYYANPKLKITLEREFDEPTEGVNE